MSSIRCNLTLIQRIPIRIQEHISDEAGFTSACNLQYHVLDITYWHTPVLLVSSAWQFKERVEKAALNVTNLFHFSFEPTECI